MLKDSRWLLTAKRANLRNGSQDNNLEHSRDFVFQNFCKERVRVLMGGIDTCDILQVFLSPATSPTYNLFLLRLQKYPPIIFLFISELVLKIDLVSTVTINNFIICNRNSSVTILIRTYLRKSVFNKRVCNIW